MIEFGLIAQKYWKLFNKSSQNWLIQVWLNKGAIPYPEQKRIKEIRVMLGTGDRKLIINSALSLPWIKAANPAIEVRENPERKPGIGGVFPYL